MLIFQVPEPVCWPRHNFNKPECHECPMRGSCREESARRYNVLITTLRSKKFREHISKSIRLRLDRH